MGRWWRRVRSCSPRASTTSFPRGRDSGTLGPRDLPLPLLPRLGGPRQAAGGAGEGRSPGDAGYPDPATLIRN